ARRARRAADGGSGIRDRKRLTRRAPVLVGPAAAATGGVHGATGGAQHHALEGGARLMSGQPTGIAAGVDVGTECVKAIVLNAAGRTLGRAVLPTRGYFQACAHEAFMAALDEAQLHVEDLVGVGATGFGMHCVPQATRTATESACHALGAFHAAGHAMTLVNIGGRDPHVIKVDDAGRRISAHGVRGCAVGICSFMMFAARHLDVSPTRLEELASAAGSQAAVVSSYCSVFSGTEVLERLREGATRS